MSKKISAAREVLVKGSLVHNPVLIQCAGLCPVIAAATSLKNAAMLATAVSIITIVTCVIASAFLKKIQRRIRVAIYLFIGIALICPVLYLIETKWAQELSLSLKIYLPLVAVNSVTAVHCEQFSVKNSVRLAFYDAAAVSLGTSAVMLVCGALREIFGNSTIGGLELNLPVTFKSAVMPFGCFLILGFLAALLRFISALRYPNLVADSASILSVLPKKKDNEDIVEIDVFDEFWNEGDAEAESPDFTLGEYDELFDQLDNIFDFSTEEDEQ